MSANLFEEEFSYKDDSNEFEGFYKGEKPKEEDRESLLKSFEGKTASEKRSMLEDQELRRQIEFGKGFAGGLTLGATDYIKAGTKLGEDINEDPFTRGTGEFIGSTLPILAFLELGGIAAAPLIQGASKSPILPKALQSVAKLTGVGLGGATYETAKEAIAGKMPSVEDVLVHGLTWAALDGALSLAGKGYRFTKSLLGYSTKTGEPAISVLNQVADQMKTEGVNLQSEKTAEVALNILDNLNKEATEKALKPPEFTLNDISTNTAKAPELAEPYLPKELKFEAIEKDAIDTYVDSQLEKYSKKPIDDKALGESVQEDINNQIKASKESYEPKYKHVEERSQHIPTVAENAEKEAKKALTKINVLKTKPAGYNTVINTLQDIVTDISNPELTVSHVSELGRRLNEILDYDIVEKSVKESLRPVKNALKFDVRVALEKEDPALLKLFNEAEAEYGATAQKFGKDNVIKIRREDNPELIASMADSPTQLEQLKQVVTPEQIKQVERRVLDRINEMPYEKATKELAQIRRQLSDTSKKLADEIIASKNPRSIPLKSKLYKDAIIDDLADSMASGTRPSKSLNLWKTQSGRDLVQKSIKDLPNKKEIVKYLQDQSVEDLIKNLVRDDGRIDFKSLNKLLQDKETVSLIANTGGKDAVTFLRDLENISNRIEHNIELYERIPKKFEGGEKGIEKISRTKERMGERLGAREDRLYPKTTAIDRFLENLKPEAKFFLHGLGLVTHAPAYTTLVGGNLILRRLIKSRRIRKALIDASAKNLNPLVFMNILTGLEASLD